MKCTLLASWLALCALFRGIGIAEADVSPDGSFSYAIDLEVPHPQSGVGPHLSLAYASRGSNGPLGVGWQLIGLAPITRINDGLGVYLNSADTFAGPSGRLIRMSGGDYHGENEDWARYVPSGTCADGPCTWTSYLPDGNVIQYDGTPVSGGPGNGAVRIWFPTSFTDPHGNRWTATYTTDPVGQATYPAEVRFDVGDSSHGAKQVTFEWENRGDAAPTWSQGTRVITSKRLARIRVTRDADLFREYRLTYDQSESTGASRLRSVAEVASDATTVGRTWSFTFDHGQTISGTERHTQSTVPWATDTTWGVDVDGDGFSDLLRMRRNDCRIWVNRYTPAGGFGPDQVSTFTCNMRPQGDRWVGDFDGDGKVDVAMRRIDVDSHGNDVVSNDVLVFRSKGDGTYAMTTWTSAGSFTAGWGPAWNTFAGDFDGDGKTDVATRLDTGAVVVRRSSGSSFELQSWLLDTGAWGNKSFTGDFDGDGRTDIFSRYQASNGYYYLRILINRGSYFRAGDYAPAAPQTANTQFLLGDFNGDGKTDFISRELGSVVQPWISYSTGLVFDARPLPIGTFGAYGDNSARVMGDFNGDGRTDLAECDGNGSAGWRILSTGDGFTRVWDPQRCDIDQLGPERIGLAADFDGDGLTDNVVYNAGQIYLHRTFAPHDVLTDVAVGAPGASPALSIDWVPAPKLPGAVQRDNASCFPGPVTGAVCGLANASSRLLAATLTQRDGRGASYATDYAYLNGRYLPGRPRDSADLGFGQMVTTNRQTGVVTDTYFLQQRPFHGLVYASRTYAIIGDAPKQITKVATSGFTQYRCTDAGCVVDNTPGLDAPRLVRASQTVTTAYEAGVELYRENKTTTVDAYGAPSNESVEIVRGSTQLAVQNTLREYIHQAASPRAIGLPKRKLIYATSATQPWLEELYAYDQLAVGQIGATLDQTRVHRRRGATTGPWEAISRRFDTFGNILSETSVEGSTTTFEYSADGRRMVATTGIAGRTQFLVDPRMNLVAGTIDGAGVQLRINFDVWRQPVEQRWERASDHTLLRRTTSYGTRSGDQQTACTFSGPLSAAPFCTTTSLDALGRKLQTLGPTGVYSTMSYDAAGFPAKVSAPFRLTGPVPVYTTIEHDVQGRVVRSTAPDGAVTQYRYNDGPIVAGAVTRRTVIDPAGRVTTTHEDAQHRPVRVEEPPSCAGCGPMVTRYTYDLYGNLTQVDKPDGSKIAIGYDGQGNRVSLMDPNSGTTTMTFHGLPGAPGYGKLATETRPAANATDPAQQTTFTLAYDASGRLSRRTTSEGTTTTWEYDDTPAGKGHVALVTQLTANMLVAYEYLYDLLGREVSRTTTVGGTLPGGVPVAIDATLATELDGSGAPLSVTFPDGTQASYQYNAYGLPIGATLDQASVSLALYNARLYPERSIYGNGTTETHELDVGTGRVRAHRLQDATHDLLSRDYLYAGNDLARMQDNVTPSLTTDYAYDALGRLAQAHRADGTVFSYGFDAGGNLTQKTAFAGNGAPVNLTRTIVPGTSRLATDGAGGTLGWSAAGYLSSHGSSTYRYDAAGQLASVSTAGTPIEHHVYDHAQQRVVSAEPRIDGALVTYNLGGLYVVRERVRNGAVTARQTTRNLVVGGKLHASIIAGDAVLEPERPSAADTPGVRYYHSDQLGSTAMVTGAGATVLSTLNYSPYGEIDGRVAAPLGEHIGFAGSERLQASGLQAMGLRAYDPQLGTFTAPDTMVGDPLRAADFHPYLYVRGKPTQLVDPDGRFPWLPVAIGFAVGLVVGGTEGGILTDPGKWMDANYLWQNWNWGKALAGAVVGGASGYGFSALGGLGGTFLGVKVSALAQSAALGGTIETLTAWGDGRQSVGDLAGAFGVGAFNGFLSRSGFFGAVDLAVNHAYSTGSGILLFGLAMAADSVTESMLIGTIDAKYPIEVSIYGLTFSHQRDGTWTRRYTFAFFEHTFFAISDKQLLADFGSLHRDKMYQRLDRALGHKPYLTYAIACWAELGLFLHEVPTRLDTGPYETEYSMLFTAGVSAVGDLTSKWLAELTIGCDSDAEPSWDYCRY